MFTLSIYYKTTCMNELETLLGFLNILDDQKPWKLNELFNFKCVSHAKFGRLGSTSTGLIYIELQPYPGGSF